MDIALESGAAFSGDGFQYIKPALAEHTLHFIGLLSDGGEQAPVRNTPLRPSWCHALRMRCCRGIVLLGGGCIAQRQGNWEQVERSNRAAVRCRARNEWRHTRRDTGTGNWLQNNTAYFCPHLPAGVHSRYDQLKQFIDGSVKQGAKRIRVHILTDGRDVPVSAADTLN